MSMYYVRRASGRLVGSAAGREKIWWQRFPEFMVVSDFGFRAEDSRSKLGRTTLVRARLQPVVPYSW